MAFLRSMENSIPHSYPLLPLYTLSVDMPICFAKSFNISIPLRCKSRKLEGYSSPVLFFHCYLSAKDCFAFYSSLIRIIKITVEQQCTVVIQRNHGGVVARAIPLMKVWMFYFQIIQASRYYRNRSV